MEITYKMGLHPNNNENGLQAFDNGTNNKWNTTNFGNYWSDWDSPDLNGDGIVDNPYIIPGQASLKDYLPLSSIYGHPKITTLPQLTVNEDDLYSVHFTATDMDTSPSSLIWTYESNASSWLSLLSNNTLFGTPQNDDVGRYWINISVSDGINSDFLYFTIEVFNTNDSSFAPLTGIVFVFFPLCQFIAYF